MGAFGHGSLLHGLVDVGVDALRVGGMTGVVAADVVVLTVGEEGGSGDGLATDRLVDVGGREPVGFEDFKQILGTDEGELHALCLGLDSTAGRFCAFPSGGTAGHTTRRRCCWHGGFTC